MKYILTAIIILMSSFAVTAKEVKVALEAELYPPYYYRESGQLTGFSVEVLESVAAKLGFQLEYKKFPWLRINQFLREGSVDMSVLYLKTAEREQFALYTDVPYVYEQYFFYCNIDNHIEFNGDFDAIKDLKIGVVRGYSYGSDFDQYIFPNKVEAGSEQQLLGMLSKGRVDLIVGDKAVMDYHIMKNKLDDSIKSHSAAIAKAPAYFVFSRAADQAADSEAQFSDELTKFINTPEYIELQKKYGL